MKNELIKKISKILLWSILVVIFVGTFLIYVSVNSVDQVIDVNNVKMMDETLNNVSEWKYFRKSVPLDLLYWVDENKDIISVICLGIVITLTLIIIYLITKKEKR